ncbi:hypothetical protein BDQ12DRAFT_720998 [Crucibulum laeve]|uniref:C2H2-type domain-containing protein n=1 Tax=Crucibulum laeve TaxID=68775 RepID=A0A5C3MJE7_9AGAR|nr:hypothetical protein BDQ12DRAFT_720998 [Crucibulum laeve]
MSETHYQPAFDALNLEYSKQQQSLDFFSFHSPSDILAPHPDLFESDIDSNLAAFGDQLQLLTVDSSDAYSILRADQFAPCGPLSTITVSSESAYDSISTRSESFYNHPNSPSYPPSNYSFPIDLDMDFQRVRVGSEYATTQPSMGMIDDSTDPTSFGPLPPTPPRSPPVPLAYNKAYEKAYEKPFPGRTSYSDCGAPRRSSVQSSAHSDYYGQIGYSSHHMDTVSPIHMSTPLPSVPAITQARVGEEYKGDPRKKYKCAVCPRAFARAYNLKTHMATHDPNRLKPHVCPHRACGRSFSRKHDLGRHLISIHRDDSVSDSPSHHGSVKPIGVEKGARTWCDSCGKGWVGRSTPCDCHDVK